jgi:hypothetical protein
MQVESPTKTANLDTHHPINIGHINTFYIETWGELVVTLLKSAEPHKKNLEDSIISKTKLKTTPNQLTNFITYATLLVICTVIFTPLIGKLSAVGFDYIAHLKWASEMEETKRLILPHPLYHLLVIFSKNILSIDYIKASTVVLVLSIFFLSALNFKLLSKHAPIAVSVFFSTCLLVITPIQLYYPIDHHLYFGYLGITLYHNPTMLLLKPLSVIAFCYALRAATSQSKGEMPSGVALALSLFFCGIAKPNFLIVILPAFVVFLFLIRRLKPMLSQLYTYAFFFCPIILVLGIQFFQTYFFQDLSHATGNSESHITFLPLATMSYYSSNLLPKFFLSIAFPFSILLCYPKNIIKDKSVVFASCCLMMGAILTYFFAESGYRMYAANFWWSGQIGMYLAFLFYTKFLLENFKNLTSTTTDKVKYTLCMLIFFLHTAFGVFFYKQELLFNSKFW